jgi:hypothetical protein
MMTKPDRICLSYESAHWKGKASFDTDELVIWRAERIGNSNGCDSGDFTGSDGSSLLITTTVRMFEPENSESH